MNAATRRVVEAVSACFGVTADDALSRSRLRCNVLARHASMYVLREYTVPRMSFPEIAREFPGHDGSANKDHCTVIAACRRMARRSEAEPVIADAIETGRQALDAARADQKALALLAKCQRRAELERQLAALNEELSGQGVAVGAAE